MTTLGFLCNFPHPSKRTSNLKDKNCAPKTLGITVGCNLILRIKKIRIHVMYTKSTDMNFFQIIYQLHFHTLGELYGHDSD